MNTDEATSVMVQEVSCEDSNFNKVIFYLSALSQ